MKIFYLIPFVGFLSCSSNAEDTTSIMQESTSDLICDCYQSEHEAIGIDFYKEINAYKEYIEKISETKDPNFSLSLLNIYQEMQNNSFETNPADTVFQVNYLESFDIDLLKKCVTQYSQEEEVSSMIEKLDNIGLSSSFSQKEQLDILTSLQEKLNAIPNSSWVEPMELNAFFYMYDRYNKKASEVKIEVMQDEILPPVPPLPPPPPSPVTEEIMEENKPDEPQ